MWTDSNVVNVSCGSEGWHPRPQLSWSNSTQSLTPKSVQYSEDSLGLLSVHSWVLVSPPTEIICRVGLQGEEEKESRLRLSHELPQTGKRDTRGLFIRLFTATLTKCSSLESTSSTAALTAVAVLLTILTIILGIAFYKSRGTFRLRNDIIVYSAHVSDIISNKGTVFVF